ncbi:MAG: rubrerythrin family protein [Atribacterota bacterium]
MHKMTQQNLENAYAGESQAHMRYLIFSDVAEKEGKSNLARLFKAISYAEQVHATSHYRELGNIQNSAKNLEMAINGENFEVEEMYPVYENTAAFQKEKGAERSAHFAWEAEKIHAQMYTSAKNEADKGKDMEIGKLYVCPVCGFTVQGSAPDQCPECHTKKELFKIF